MTRGRDGRTERADDLVHQVAREEGFSGAVRIAVGSRTLVSAAKQGDLLVVGTRGRGAVAGTILGSTSSYCAANSTVPISATLIGAYCFCFISSSTR